MDLNPCRCGEVEFEPQHWLEQVGDQLVANYQGTCPGCGTDRMFRFELDSEPPPPAPAYGGDKPSQLIDPGQFLWVAEQLAGSVPADPGELDSTEDQEEAVEALETAVAALEEVLKFVPAGADAVPEEAFTAPEGWMVYQQEPGRFRRDRLRAVLAAYREMLLRHSRAAG
jgi:hypothetical protein